MLERLPEDRANTGPATRARFEYQDECIALTILDHWSDGLAGVLIEHSTDAVLIPLDAAPELISIKHREPHHGVDSGWTWSALEKDSVLSDLYSAWVATEKRVTVAFLSNAGMSGPAKILWNACRKRDPEVAAQVSDRISKMLKVSKSEAVEFIANLNFPEHPLPRRNEITDVGVRKMEAHLVRLGMNPGYGESCYRTLLGRIAEAGTDRPDSRRSHLREICSTVRADVIADFPGRFASRYLSVEEIQRLLNAECRRLESTAAPLTMRSGTVLIRPIEELDPVVDMGIHLPTRSPDWRDLPAYVWRNVDGRLDEELLKGGFILLEGNSAAGKSRTGYEALRRNAAAAGWRAVVVPSTGESIRDLLVSGHDFSNTAIWLDDLERYLGGGGLDAGALRALCAFSNTVILSTVRSRAKAAMLSVGRGGSDAAARKTLSASTTIRLSRELDSSERARATELRADPRISSALDRAGAAGFAEYIAAGPAAVERWLTGKDGGNEIGAALISAAIDFRKAGYLAPVPREWIAATYSHYLGQRTRRRERAEDLAEAFSWATEEVEGASSCLEPVDEGAKYEVFDYLLDYSQLDDSDEDETEGVSAIVRLRGVPDVIWHEIADRISFDDSQFMGCVAVSSISEHPALDYAFRDRLAAGKVPKRYLSDPDRLMHLARACLSVRLCIACQCAVLGIDLQYLMQVAIDALRPLFSRSVIVPSSSQIVCLDIFQELGNEGSLEGAGSIFEACEALPLEDLQNIQRVLMQERRLEAAGEWERYVGARRPREWIQASIFEVDS
ncbi:hypothetical protein ACFRAR_06940 [Kitasatospora sp. NPDC056651]|uniref:hypothetical protein n=1 Tax=Kitasatospora sp. NPDC056651 TaxID=3345892 RepID=UPI0036A19086